MSSEIIAAIDKELEQLKKGVQRIEIERDNYVAKLRGEIAEQRVACAEAAKTHKDRIKHLERMRKVETGEAKVVVTRGGNAGDAA